MSGGGESRGFGKEERLPISLRHFHPHEQHGHQKPEGFKGQGASRAVKRLCSLLFAAAVFLHCSGAEFRQAQRVRRTQVVRRRGGWSKGQRSNVISSSLLLILGWNERVAFFPTVHKPREDDSRPCAPIRPFSFLPKRRPMDDLMLFFLLALWRESWLAVVEPSAERLKPPKKGPERGS